MCNWQLCSEKLCFCQPEGVHSVGSIPTPRFNQFSRVILENTQVLFVCQYSLSGLATACHLSFPSCEEYHTDPNLSWDPDLGKPQYVLRPVREMSPTQHFRMLFVVFVPDSPTIATNPRVVESLTVSIPVEHSH